MSHRDLQADGEISVHPQTSTVADCSHKCTNSRKGPSFVFLHSVSPALRTVLENHSQPFHDLMGWISLTRFSLSSSMSIQ